MKKLKSNRGETLIETLCATVIFTLCMLMLSQAIVSASKVNQKADTVSKPLQVTTTTEPTVEGNTVTVAGTTIVDGETVTGEGTQINVAMYTTVDGYQYYALPTPVPVS